MRFDELEDLTKELPLPLADAVARRLGEGEASKRYQLTFDTYEALLYYVTAVAVASYVHAEQRVDMEIDKQLLGLDEPTLGTLTDITRAILRDPPPDELSSELATAWRETGHRDALRDCFGAIDEVMRRNYGIARPPRPDRPTLEHFFDLLAAYRNRSRLGHGATADDDEEQTVCAHLEKALLPLAESLQCLWRRPLAWIQEIRRPNRNSSVHVDFWDLALALKLHPLKRALVFKIEQEHVYLRADGVDFLPVVDLDPLVVYEKCSQCNKQRVFYRNGRSGTGLLLLSRSCGHQITTTHIPLMARWLESKRRAPTLPLAIAPTPAPMPKVQPAPSYIPSSDRIEVVQPPPGPPRPEDPIASEEPTERPARPRRRVGAMLAMVAVVVGLAVARYFTSSARIFGSATTDNDASKPPGLIAGPAGAATAPAIPAGPAPRLQRERRAPPSEGRWVPIPSGVNVALNGVWCGDDGLVIAVGDGGTILRSEDHGGTWAAIRNEPNRNLFGVAGDGARVLAAGGSRLLASDDRGRAWTVVGAPAGAALMAVHVDGDDAFLAGEQGRMYQGTWGRWREPPARRWRPWKTHTGDVLRALWPAGDTLWVAVRDGAVLACRNGDCRERFRAPMQFFFGISGGGDRILLAGKSGVRLDDPHGQPLVLRTDDGGRRWEPLVPITGSHNMLFSVVAAGADRMWAFGIGETALQTSDGGKSWQRESVRVGPLLKKRTLKAACIDDDGHVIVVGSSGTVLRRQ